MVRLNLQLFAVATSIVDLLNSQGKDSSFSARKQYAEQNGITNYTGTAEQNKQLISIFSGGNNTTTKTTNTTNNNTANTTKTTNTTNTTKTTTPSVSVKGVDKSLTDALTRGYQMSPAVQEAMTKVQEILSKIEGGKTSYTDQVKDLIGQIQNREAFSYDVDSDQLFQQYLSSMMQSGQTAMQDTIGQASMLTGGYGSSYATSAGNQAYNQYIQGAYDNLPEYYQMALSQYEMEGENMYNLLGALSEADAQEWGRLMDEYTAFNNNANTLYDRDYAQYSDTMTTYKDLANMQQSEYWNQQTLNQSQSQFIAQNDLNGDGKVDSKDHDLAYQRSQSSSGGNNGGSGGKEPTQKQYDEIIRLLNAEGEDAVYKYVDSLGADIDVDAVNNYINKYGRGTISGRTFTMIPSGQSVRYAGKVNHGVFVDQYGNEYTIEEIKAIDKNAYEKLKNIKNGQKIKID